MVLLHFSVFLPANLVANLKSDDHFRFLHDVLVHVTKQEDNSNLTIPNSCNANMFIG